MNWNALLVATAIGTVAQVAMVIAGHYSATIRDKVFMIGGMAISLVAGLIYVLMTAGGWGDALIGGAIAGGVSALIGIVVSVVLGDTATAILAIGTISSAVTGLVGGAIGKLIG